MKKFLLATAMILGIFVAQMSQASAQDFHVGEWNDGWKAYLMTETIRIERRDCMDYSCRVKAVRGNEVMYVDYTFWEDRQRLGIEHFKNSLGHSGNFNVVLNANGFYIEYKINNYVFRHYYD